MQRFNRVESNPAPRTASYPQGGGAWCPPFNPFRGGGVVLPHCGKPVRPACDVETVGFRQAAIAAATGTTFTVAPTRSEYFQGLAVRLTVVDGTDPDTNRRLEVHSITINAIPQDAFVNAGGPVAGNTSVIHSDVWTVPEGYGVPVSWGIFAQANLIHTLQLGVFTRYAAAAVDCYTTVFGNPLSTLPAGYTLGTPMYGVEG